MGQNLNKNLQELRLWMSTCGCNKSAIHWSSEFNARICQNCGVIFTEDEYNNSIDINSDFVHLKVYSHLSIGMLKNSDIVSKAKEYNMSAVSKIEYGNMCGVPSFVKECVDNNIKPIIGVEFDILFDNDLIYKATFIALNSIGYSQLVNMTTLANCDRNEKPYGVHIKVSDIYRSDNLICIISPNKNRNNFMYATGILYQILPLYIEVSPLLDQELINLVLDVSNTYNIKIVATGDVKYADPEDKYAYGMFLDIKKYADYNYYDPEQYDNWFKPKHMMHDLYNFDKEWLENTIIISNLVVDYGIINNDFIVPTYKDGGKEYTDLEEVHKILEMKAWTGLYNKGLSNNKEYIDRLSYELQVMKDKKFSSYFLLISEIINWMSNNNILRPIGRGSSVGSLVCYTLDIISIDPIRWNVPFERFIHSGRKDLPDIDTDISQERRPDVIRHIADVHGDDRTAHIATYQTLKLRAAIDNVARILQIPYATNNEIKKNIPEDVETWDDLDDNTQNIVEKSMEFNKDWLNFVKRLTGVSKNFGSHAAGIVISNKSFSGLVPLFKPSSKSLDTYITQYDMHDCDVLGLLKLDMLGLRNIDIIQHTIERIKEKKNIDVDIYNLPMNDEKSFKLVSSSNYVSLFQLDSTGYRRLCGDLQPSSFEHMMALNALYRPGPIESGVTAMYSRRRHGQEEAVSWHPWLDSVLSDTYQTVLYQEQAMAMSRIIAGFTDVEADKFRKGIGKKNQEIVNESLAKFKDGALKMEGLTVPPGYDGTLEKWIDELIEKLHGYARYMWNRGHSAGYGYITYITAYLESNYPTEYYASLLDACNSGSAKKRLPTLLRSIAGHGKCNILPPNINESGISYDVGSDNELYMGLSAVVGVANSAQKIVDERKKNGKFKSYIDFCQRLPSINKKVKINLVKAGAFSWDTMLCDRDKVDNTDMINKIVRKKNKKFDGSKISTFEIAMMLDSVNGYDYTEMERNNNEREVLNSYITNHPALVYLKLINNLERGITKIVTPSQFNKEYCDVGDSVAVIGMLDSLNKKFTKPNPSRRSVSRPYLNLGISDNHGSIICNIWWPLCDDVEKFIAKNQLIIVEGGAKDDRYDENKLALHIKTVINISNGLPVRGVFTNLDNDSAAVVNMIGGFEDNTTIINNRKFTSIRGIITIQPDILLKAIDKFGDDVSYLVSGEE